MEGVQADLPGAHTIMTCSAAVINLSLIARLRFSIVDRSDLRRWQQMSAFTHHEVSAPPSSHTHTPPACRGIIIVEG